MLEIFSSRLGRRALTFSFLIAISLPLALPAFAQHRLKASNPKPPAGVQNGPPSQVGQWSAPVDWGVWAIHLALLHTGKVVGYGYPQGNDTLTPAMLYDTVTGTVTDITLPFPGDFFCGAQNLLKDGRLMISGGLVGNPHPGGTPDKGINLTAFFDPATETWTQGPDMNYARWYPTSIELTSGSVMEITGKDQNANYEPVNETFSPDTNTWTILPTGANISPGHDTFLKMKLLPTGKVFNAGSDAQTMLFSPGNNVWQPLGQMNFGNRYHGTAVLLPGLKKVMAVGGTQTYSGGGATATAEVIDLSAASPQWNYVSPMNIPRYNANTVILADGTLLEVGGNQTSRYNDPVMTAELYDPTADTWTEMAAQADPRPYHSTAILLPDGTVMSAGSDNPLNYPADSQYEIFSPPYLFKNQRPTITSVSATSLGYNQPFTITTAESSAISTVAFVRPGAVTHDNDMDQRYVRLNFTKGSGVLSATSPANASSAPPGWYMLVIVAANGAPSKMTFVQLQ